MEKRTDRKKKFKKRWIWIPLAVVFLLVAGIAGYGFSLLNKAKEAVDTDMHKPVDSIDLEETKDKVKASEPLNVLLLGVDEREDDRGRSDAMVVLSLDPKNDAMKLVSIPRDTRTEIIGKNTVDKINHAYAFGGADMSVATVENFLDIDLDYYVRMNMEGMQELVDQIGPITVDNEVEWSGDQYDFDKGPVQMNGDKMMRYVRMRKQDPNGDFGRTDRQRKVIESIVDRGASVSSIPKISSMIEILGSNMVTNMDFDDMKDLLSDYRNTRKNMESYMVKGTGKKIDGIYYLIVPDEEVQEAHEMIEKAES